jgi:rfaE bifunctional protein kinase chain/domain
LLRWTRCYPQQPDGGRGLDSSHLISLIGAFRGKRVVVIGDVVADEFVYGRVARVSREAPVLILEYDSTEIVPGGAGNAANNVAALGGHVALVAAIGRDDAGKRAMTALHRRVDPRFLVRRHDIATVVKTRILAGGVHSAKQQIVRIDRAVPRAVDPRARQAIEKAALTAARQADAVLVSDYGSGLVTPALVRKISSQLRREGHPIPILVDSRYKLLEYTGLTMSTPNESEVEQALGIRIGDNLRALERAGREMLERTKMQAILVTRGSRGMALFTADAPTLHIPISGTEFIVDVTGAGDTVVATVTLALAAGGTFEAAARLANYAGGLVVMKRGTATVTADELRAVAAPARRGGPSSPPKNSERRGGPSSPSKNSERRGGPSGPPNRRG